VQYLGFVNLTPFAAQPLLLADEQGAELFTFVVKATFALQPGPDTTLALIAGEQMPVCVAPVHYGEPATSSVKFESETAPVKLGTDVVLIGHARPQYGRGTLVDVYLSVGPARVVVRVFGNRVWTTALGRWMPSAPEPFDAMPLVYERAFGGWDRSSADPARHDYEPRNPVGVGFVSKKHGTLLEGAPLPNLENPYEPIGNPTDRPAPVGFGFVGPHWEPRKAFAGTYDDRWEAQRMPLLPDDFDRRFYNSASPALALRGFLRGGEPVEVLNASTRGALRFSLPVAQPYATVRMKDGATHRVGMAMDTVILDTDEHRLLMLWRGSLPIRSVHDVLWTKTQLVATGGAAQ
jgi:hypothetical protein